MNKLKRGTGRRPLVVWLVCLVASPWLIDRLAPAAQAAPGAPRLMPERTLVFARIEDVTALRETLAASSLGQMLDNPQLRPFAGDLFKMLQEFFEQVSGDLGVTLDEVLEIPQGQFAFALVAEQDESEVAEAGRDESPEAIRRRIEQRQREQARWGVLLIVETGQRSEALFRILEQVERRVARGGAVERVESLPTAKVRRWVDPSSGRSRLEYFHREETTIIGFGHRVASEALERWDNKAAGKSLAESAEFAAVMNRCIGAAETQPQVTAFVDPYRLVKRIVQGGGVPAMLGWQIAEQLEVSKIRGMGLSTFHGGEVFSDVVHAHILVDPPRDGIFSVLRPTAGDPNPPRWVPDDVTSYTSLGWRAEATYDGLGRILDKFQGEGTLARTIEQSYQRRLGGDFRQEIIEMIDDRVVFARWLQPPVRVNSSVSITGLQLKDPAAAAVTLEKVSGVVAREVSQEMLGTTRIYLGPEPGNFPDGLRRPRPCAAIVGQWLLISDSREFVERAIRADGGALPQLATVPDYLLVASELGAELGGEKPFLLSFTRASEILRQVYELAKSDQTADFLRQRGQQSRAAGSLAELLGRSQLPPFEEFKKYFAPTGTFAYDEPNGIHVGQFTLQP